MKIEIETAVKALSLAAGKSTSHDEAMKYAQSVLNLVNALAVLDRIEKPMAYFEE
jgi:hypothetical protein|tara:strand:+ start:1654 stop:1818 length:165 start_codon:yes stop_codon:yes gene_type:complete